jgi:hypothetical protein
VARHTWGLPGLPELVSHHTSTPVGDFTLPEPRFLHVNICVDLTGPLPTSAAYIYCITAIHRFTR